MKTYGEYGNTERRKCHFVIRQYSEGDWIVVIEPDENDLNALKGGVLALEIQSGTLKTKALEVADFLNSNVEGISFTRLPSNP